MGSQRSVAEDTDVLCLLEEAAQWTDEETRQKLPTLLPVVENFMRSAPPVDNGLQVAGFVISSLLPHLPVEREAFQLLDVLLPLLQNMLTSFLDKCIANGEKNMKDVQQTLQQSIMVMENCLLAVQFLLQADSILVESIGGLPKSFHHIINSSLKHLSSSKDTYGECLELISDSISALCHLTVDLSSKYATLVSKYTWDTYSEEDLEILVFTCEQLCITASFLSELSDLRAFVTVWRTYASLVSHHHSCLITNLEIAKPLAALTKEIKNGFQMLTDLPINDLEQKDKNQKISQRTLKTVNFCLKIVVSLCEKFRGYLRGAHSHLVSLLFYLFRFSPGNMMLEAFPDHLKKEVENQTTIGIEPLLLHLRDDDTFIKMLLEAPLDLNEELCEDWGSYLLLILTVAIPPSAILMMELKRFLNAIFCTMQKSHVSLSLSCKMDGVMCRGRLQSKVSLYEHTLTRLCVVVANLDADQFSVLEESLVKWLLSGQTWPALLAADVWCFVARYGTSELCLTHCMELMDLLSHVLPYTHQGLTILSLLSRLVPKLAPQDKDKFMHSLKEKGISSNVAFTLLMSFLPKNENVDLQELYSSKMKSSSRNINIISSKQGTESHWCELAHELESFSTAYHLLIPSSSNTNNQHSVSEEKKFADSLAELWNRIPEKFMNATAVDHIVAKLALASLSYLKYFTNKQLIQIFFLCKKYTVCGTPVVCVAIANMMEALGHIAIGPSPEQDAILSLIAECMCGLLKNPNPFVHQCSLDAFVTFGQHTVHENVLPLCLEDCDEDMQNKVTSYLKQEPHPLPDGHTRLSVLQKQGKCITNTATHKNSHFVSINDICGHQIRTNSTVSLLNGSSEQDSREVKKRRLDEDKSYGVSNAQNLIRNLKESHRLMRDYVGSGAPLSPADKSEIKKCLQELLISVDQL